MGKVPTPQIQLNLNSDISKVFPRHTYRVDTDLNLNANGVIEGPPPGQLQSKCFLVFIGGQYLDQLGEVMEKVKSVGKAVRMGAPVLYCTVLYCTGEDGGALRCVHHEECEHYQPGPCIV